MLIAGNFMSYIPIACFFITLALFLSILFIGSAFICSQFYTKVICRDIRARNKNVFITFDDSPDKTETPLVLEVLKKHDIKATFFIIGEKAEENIELVKEIAGQGHVLGNHSYSHKNYFPLRSTKKIIKEIKKTDNLINSVRLSERIVFRPPFGVTNPSIAKAIKRLKVYTIGWSLKSFDTVTKKRERVLKRLINRTRPGDIVLLHDPVKNIHIVLDKYIEFLKKNNYNFETVDKLLSNE